jgi:signal transduction histidine kinase
LKDAHALLTRQLRRAQISVESLDDATRKWLETVDATYKDFDDDRRMLERSLELSSQELMGANAELRALLSERNEAERRMELLHAERLEAASLLAAGVAHDFNNLLTVIAGSNAAMMKVTAEEDPRYELLGQIAMAANRAAALTRQLLAFSRRQALKPKVIDLNQTIRNLAPIFRSLLGDKIELRSSLDPTLPFVTADPTQIEQVVLNLVINACDAMPKGGRLLVETARASRGEAQLSAGAASTYVRLSVRDTGCGMSAEVKARIFEPFFTTKNTGKGTGLGLSTVYGIVHQSGGSIAVDSETGKGATFRVYLPETKDTAPTITSLTAK